MQVHCFVPMVQDQVAREDRCHRTIRVPYSIPSELGPYGVDDYFANVKGRRMCFECVLLSARHSSMVMRSRFFVLVRGCPAARWDTS